MKNLVYILRNDATWTVSMHRDLNCALDAVGREIGPHDRWVIFELERSTIEHARRVTEGRGRLRSADGATEDELLDVCGAAEVCEEAYAARSR